MKFKISVLVFVRNPEGKLLLMERRKEPNMGVWSPIGGKLEMELGESPFECAMRETKEEIGLELSEQDLHLFAMVSEKAYEGSTHWLMFLFDCKKPIENLPSEIDEGRFEFFDRAEIDFIKIPETDKKFIWRYWDTNREGFTALRADCRPENNLEAIEEQSITPTK